MESPGKECQLLLAIQAMKQDPNLSARAATKLYSVSRRTVQRRLDGIASRRDTTPNSQKLTKLEENIIAQYVLGLDS